MFSTIYKLTNLDISFKNYIPNSQYTIFKNCILKIYKLTKL